MKKKYGIWCSEPSGGWWITKYRAQKTSVVVFLNLISAQQAARRMQKAAGGSTSDLVYSAKLYVADEKRKPLKRKKLIGVLTPTGLIPASEGVARKFLRMTLAERTKFVELFASFSDADWRQFKRWIKKLKEE